MKKKNIISLIKYYVEKNDAGFRNEAYEIAREFDASGDYQLSEYIMSLLSNVNTFVPQVSENVSSFFEKIEKKEDMLLLPEEITGDLLGVVNAIEHHIGINKFLFQGAPGTGKTEAVKQLARILNREIFMVDFSAVIDSKLGQTQKNLSMLFKEINSFVQPNRVIVLFDEIEKAHPDVFNILLQVLDDGHITDSKGRKVSFKNAIIIMTSNAGASRIVDPKNLGFATKTTEQQDYQRMKNGVMEEVKRLFKPEFINRIDEIMVFHPLNKTELREIVTLLSANLIKRCDRQMGITLSISQTLKNHLVEKYCDVKMGARPLKRAIQTVIEDPLAEEILQGRIRQGDHILATIHKEKVVFKQRQNAKELDL